MTAIPDLSSLLNLLTGGGAAAPQFLPTFKTGRVGAAVAAVPIAGRWTSLWQYEGQPGSGAVPGSPGGNTDNTTFGGLLQADPTGGRQLWLVGQQPAPLAAGTLMFYDRLSQRSGMSGTTTTPQTVSLTPNRYTSAAASVGNQLWLEIYTLIGITGTTITASYTNQAGTAGRTTVAQAFGNTGFREAQRMIRLPLQSGDTGVTAVNTVTVLATTGTAGDFGVTIVRPLLMCPCPAVGVSALRDLIAGYPNVTEMLTDACLAFAFLPNTTTVPEFDFHTVLVEN